MQLGKKLTFGNGRE